MTVRVISYEELEQTLAQVLADVAEYGHTFTVMARGRHVASIAPTASVSDEDLIVANASLERSVSGTALSVRGLRLLYVGTDDTERDLHFYLDTLGAEFRWRFRRYGADVAAVSLGGGPLIVLADHRRGRGVLPIFDVDDLRAALAAFSARGYDAHRGPIGTPEGPAVVVEDPSGNQIALLQPERPSIGDAAYADRENEHAVRN
jgi:predicted enzyme related to lactoylglutathione lyase/antitoxin (DNA-binding transcriptional repressor) of toxin-antitoxin stability system